MCFDTLHSLSGTYLVLRIQQHFINVCRSSSKIPVIRVTFVESNWNFLDTFSKNLQSSNLMIILLVGAEFLRADGRTDRHVKDNSRFPYFLRSRLKRDVLFRFHGNSCYTNAQNFTTVCTSPVLLLIQHSFLKKKSGQGRPLFQGAL